MGAHSAIWQGYVDSRYRTSPIENLPRTISPEELSGLISAYSSSDTARANGIVVGGEKFVVIRADDRSLYGKKGKEGIVIVRAKSCVMVTHHPDNVQTTNAATIVEKLVDYINAS
ncbi:hypothetical protein EYZ11_006093 [Aspergillus tanneri]|uniref:Profilin n=1 Tax=Aspergillus tanneri TaxID=1220188 RepID=A0A4S3JGW2_9EURO|nr:hypothetical protein EYZ11_006093 [Aspergillus tanneri]